MFAALKNRLKRLSGLSEGTSPAHYRALRRLLTVLMVTVSVAPLLILSAFSHMQYMRTVDREMASPLYTLARKSCASLELFLGERFSTVSFVAHAHSFADLNDAAAFRRIFLALSSEFQGFVDMGLVNSEGRQAHYVGPYRLEGADYAGQPWLREVETKGGYISNVFLGLRDFPHMIMAVHRLEADGTRWTLRATIDISQLEQSLMPAGPDLEADIFLCDSRGVLQTTSRLYGKALDSLPLTLPPAGLEPTVSRITNADGQQLLVATALLKGTDLRLVAVKPGREALRPWTILGTELLLVLCGGIVIIMLVSHLLMKALIGRLQAADEHRTVIFAQMEHQQKLSSIGRLAAGVAHEINNPLSIVNEKAGLALDMLRMQKTSASVPQQERLIALLEGVEKAVERARGITHRLLGFSRRMEASLQPLSLGDVIAESMEFLQREADSRRVHMSVHLPENLPQIISDRSQLQQVFLNVLGNALDALSGQKDGGRIEVGGKLTDENTVAVSIHDNGKGMPPEKIKHIFEPFYSDKKDKGTGLGMFITYAIVRRLGGNIVVQSQEDLGTTVHIALPLTPPVPTVEV